MIIENIALPAPNAGSTSFLKVFRFGPVTGPKVYIQAGLHADEHPGLLTAQRLIAKLKQLEQNELLHGNVVVVPFANPIGLRQRVFGHVTGRYDLHTGQNFNRGMAINSQKLLHQLKDQLTDNPHLNDQRLRASLLQQVHAKVSDYEIEALHKALLSLSIDANYVLDLHCDDAALGHLFYGNHQRALGVQLARCLNFSVALEEDVTGTVAFDGTHTQPWVAAMNEFGSQQFAQPCFAATIELRGKDDVSNELAEQDASGILQFLAEQGVINLAENFAVPAPTDSVECYAVNQVRLVPAPMAGIVTYQTALGEWVKEGSVIANLVLLDADTPTNYPILAPCEGRLMGQSKRFLAAPGQPIAMIASMEQQIEAGLQLDY